MATRLLNASHYIEPADVDKVSAEAPGDSRRGTADFADYAALNSEFQISNLKSQI
jgi:hypothetical protein